MTDNSHELRSLALRARRRMSPDRRRKASQTICNKITSSHEFLSASRIGCYLPMRDEVDTRLIIERAWRANKRIFAPIARNSGEMLFREIRPNTTLRRNQMRVWEPDSGDFAAPRELQLVVTPTVAFDTAMHRIGMGGGYFDRCFSFLRHRKYWLQPKLIGIAYECQKVEEISPNTWDIRLYRLVHE